MFINVLYLSTFSIRAMNKSQMFSHSHYLFSLPTGTWTKLCFSTVSMNWYVEMHGFVPSMAVIVSFAVLQNWVQNYIKSCKVPRKTTVCFHNPDNAL